MVVWLFLGLLLAMGGCVAYWLVLIFDASPIAVISAAGSAAVAWRGVRRRIPEDAEGAATRILFASILAGVGGAVAEYAVTGGSGGVPAGLPWFLTMALGIGGAIGVGIGALVVLVWCAADVMRTIRRWRSS